MAFIYERLSSDAANALRAQVGAPTVLSFSHMQVIDRDRNAVFVSLGGRGDLPDESHEPPDHFALLLDGGRALFE